MRDSILLKQSRSKAPKPHALRESDGPKLDCFRAMAELFKLLGLRVAYDYVLPEGTELIGALKWTEPEDQADIHSFDPEELEKVIRCLDVLLLDRKELPLRDDDSIWGGDLRLRAANLKTWYKTLLKLGEARDRYNPQEYPVDICIAHIKFRIRLLPLAELRLRVAQLQEGNWPRVPNQGSLGELTPAGIPQPSTPQPSTPQPGTPQPGTPQPGTPQPGTPQPGTPQPGIPQSGTPQSGTPQSGTPQPSSPKAGEQPMGLQETGSEATPTNLPDFGNGGNVLTPEPEKKKDTSVRWGGCVERVDLLVELDSGVRICIPLDYDPLPPKGHVSGRRSRQEVKGVYDGRDYPVRRQGNLFQPR